MRQPTWKQLFVPLGIATALIVLLIWDQTDRPVTQEIVVEPAVLVTPSTPETTTSTIDFSWLNTTTTTTVIIAAQVYSTDSVDAFFECVRWRESRGNYEAVDPSGTFRGAYQIYQGGWDAIASSIGRTDLVGIQPNTAAVADQDVIAYAMYDQLGSRPWGGACS